MENHVNYLTFGDSDAVIADLFIDLKLMVIQHI